MIEALGPRVLNCIVVRGGARVIARFLQPSNQIPNKIRMLMLDSFSLDNFFSYKIFRKVSGLLDALHGDHYKYQLCKNGRTCTQTYQYSFLSYQEHLHKVSLKSDEQNSRYLKTFEAK